MRIGISGANGFIGSTLFDYLVRQGHSIDKLNRQGHIDENYEIVFDLAAYGNLNSQNQGRITNDAREIYQANLTRILNEINNLSGYEKFIYISTSSVTLPTQTPYSLSKKAAEEYIRYIRKVTDRKMAIVRPYTIIGKGEPKEHLIPKLIDSCLNDTLMPFVPEPVHDFLDVRDFVEALEVVINNGQLMGETYEIGSGKQLTNDEVRLTVEKVTGKRANIQVSTDSRKYDTNIWCSSNEGISNLGWKPKYNLEDTIKWMME